MTSLEQAEALFLEYTELIKTQQGEIIALRKEIKTLQDDIEELKFELSSDYNREYDV